MDTDMVVSARRRRATTLLASLAVVGALLVSGTVSASLAQDPSPMPSASGRVIHGWPGAHGDPPGLYSWTVGEPGWMHGRNPADGPESERVEITFQALADDAYRIDPVTGLEMLGDDIDGPFSEVPERLVDTRLQAWMLDLDGTRVVITVKSYPDTAASLVAEAEAIVASIRVEPDGTGPGRRLMFELPARWGSD